VIEPAMVFRNAISTLAVAGLCAGPLLAVGLSAARAETLVCRPWPGEPNPLPRIDSSDPFLARWAQLRAQELARVASELEASDPREAHEAREHLRCLDPAGEFAPPVHERGDPGVTEVATTPPVASPPLAHTPDWSPIDAELGAAEAQVRGARFQQALLTADQIRSKLGSIEDVPGAILRRAQLEVLAATAQIALGHNEAARESFQRALAADPELELDAGSTSPKIRRVFETVRDEFGSRNP
jgi:hypothetical protein